MCRLLTLFLSLCIHITSAEELTIVGSVFCPYVCAINDADHGIAVNLLTTIFQQHDIKFSYINAPFKRALEIVRHDKTSVIPGIYKTDAPDLIFPEEPLLITSNYFFKRKGFNWTDQGEDSWQDVRIGIVDGYTFGHQAFDAYMKAQRYGSKVIHLSGDQPLFRLFKMLLTNKIDLVVDDPAFLAHFLTEKKLPSNAIVKAGKLNESALYSAFSPKNPAATEYAKLITEALRELKKGN